MQRDALPRDHRTFSVFPRSRAGRNSADRWRVVGVDLGAGNAKIGVVELPDLRVSCPSTIPTGRDCEPEALFDAVADEILSRGEGLPVGISSAGVIDRSGKVLQSPNLPRFVGCSPGVEIGRRLGIVAPILNDANAALLGELARSRAAISDVVALTLGTGVGGAALSSGRLVIGVQGHGAEFGHMKIRPGGAPCACSKRGCLEAYVGTAAIRSRASRKFRRSGEAHLSVNPKDVARRAREGHDGSRDVLRAVGYDLGLGIANLSAVLDPRFVILSGGISRAFDLMEEGMLAGLRDHAFGACCPTVAATACPNDMAIIGGAATWIASAAASASVKRAFPSLLDVGF